MNQTTLAKDVVILGIGLHSGAMSRVIVRSAGADAGIVFRQNGVDVPARAGLVRVAPLCTLVEDAAAGVRISTVEHLLAALHGLGIDNAVVEVEGEEVPILDGSALPWVEAIDNAGRQELEAPKRALVVGNEVRVEDGSKYAVASPHAGAWLSVDVTVDYPHPLIGVQRWKGIVDEQVFRTQIAPARTFVLEKDIEAVRAAGLVRGGGLDNAVVFGSDGRVMNPERLRFADEPVRHKVLDLIGDLYMGGRAVHGRVTAVMPGHGLNNGLLRKIVG